MDGSIVRFNLVRTLTKLESLRGDEIMDSRIETPATLRPLAST